MYNFINKYLKLSKNKDNHNLINNNSIKLYIRKELNKYEKRTAIVPKDIENLKNNNFIIYVESSENRIYNDNLYHDKGAIITNLKWYDDFFNDALIIGLKDFDDQDMLNNHIHIYFSHSYKNQYNSKITLNYFKISSSIIYDLEFFKNNINKRLTSFGFYAGFVGGSLGLMQYYSKKNNNKNISSLKYWNDSYSIKNDIIKLINEGNKNNNFISVIKNRCNSIFKIKSNDNLFNNLYDLKIGIIGSNGNCGNGVKNILDDLNFNYISINKDNINLFNLKEFDILFNCILLDENYNKIWFDENTIFEKNIIIVDISCDFTKKNNPVQLYYKNTTFEFPVYSYNEYVDIIAIDNLPSLLPKDSSDYFSDKFIELLLDYKDDSNNYWKNNKQIFLNIINNEGLNILNN
jgi:saccharopine dehydrogenase (NAD+, L-lysine-forming)